MFITLGPTIATAQTYERFSRSTQVIPTIDGMWTTEDEWTDGQGTWIGTDVVFTSTWDMQGSDVYTRWIVEFLTDTTNDTGDSLIFCIDPELTGGGSPLMGNHAMFSINGHTELVWYTGDGTGWIETSMITQSEIEWATTLSPSPTNSTPHWILEFQKVKGAGEVEIDIYWSFFLRVYDANNTESLAWPPNGNFTVPNTWGTENFSSEPPTEPIPEGLTFAVMALLTTVSMLVGYRYFVKKKETKTK